MKKITLFCVLLLAFVQVITALENSDRDEIQSVITGYVNAWNFQEGRGFADAYAEDADFVNIYGMHFAGKAEIEILHLRILQTFLKGSIFEAVSVQLREIKPDLVLAHVLWKVDGFRSRNEPSAPGKTRQGVFSHVFVKQNDRWEITSTQNTLIPE